MYVCDRYFWIQLLVLKTQPMCPLVSLHWSISAQQMDFLGFYRQLFLSMAGTTGRPVQVDGNECTSRDRGCCFVLKAVGI